MVKKGRKKEVLTLHNIKTGVQEHHKHKRKAVTFRKSVFTW